jgi:hypothetical protein
MSGRLERELLAQRAALCLELEAQRQVIARQLGVGPITERAFPRSHTMQLLAHRPLQVFRLAIGLIGLIRRR